MTPRLALGDLRLSWGAQEVLRGVDLCLGAGELVGLIGPNGSGKSSLMRACAGLVPCAGRLAVESFRQLSRRSATRGVAFSFNLPRPREVSRQPEPATFGPCPRIEEPSLDEPAGHLQSRSTASRYRAAPKPWSSERVSNYRKVNVTATASE